MELQKNRIAMVAPSLNAYSETFIQAQKNGLKGSVFYYYGGLLPRFLENQGVLLNRSILIRNKIKRKIGLNIFTADEEAFIYSLKKNKIQVVLAQFGLTAHRIVKICKYLNIPLITHFHGYDASDTTAIKNCKNYQEVFEFSSYVVAVSKKMEDKLLSLGCPREKLVYNTYGPNPSFLDLEPTFSQENFVALGRFVDKKAPYYTILAFNQVVKKYPMAKLIIGGEGPLHNVCTNLIKHLKIERSVFLPGVLSAEEFMEHLKNSIAFVQHSVTSVSGDQEGTPVAVLEASAAGLPVIATKHAGIPDIIIDGETGLLVDEHDVELMTDKMILVLENKESAMQLGKKGKERIKSNFTLKRHLEVLDDLIDDVIRVN